MQTLDCCSLTEIARSSVIALCHPELRPIAAKMQFISNVLAHVDVNPAEFEVLLDRSQNFKRAVKTATTLEEVKVFCQGRLSGLKFLTKHVVAMSDEQAKDLKTVQAIYRAAVQNSPYLCAVHTLSGMIVDCNFTKQRIGKDRDECLGQSIYEVFPDVAGATLVNFTGAKNNPGRKITRECKMQALGVPTKFEWQTILYKNLVYVTIKPLDSFPWLFSYL